ncbi:MAG: deoxyribodipyrimidine photo-lyase, partial [Calditrichota bacterium]
MSKIAVFWFRRDLRLEDNVGLHAALKGDLPVLPLFIFDSDILDALQDRDDRRVEFIHHHLSEMQQTLHGMDSSLLVVHGKPLDVWQKLLAEFDVAAVHTNHDYEPYATERDEAVQNLLESRDVSFQTYKDQVIFEKTEILSGQDKPYTVYTPYKNKWRSLLMGEHIRSHPSEEVDNFLPVKAFEIPSLESMGFVAAGQKFPSAELREELVRNYHDTRNIPSIEGIFLVS